MARVDERDAEHRGGVLGSPQLGARRTATRATMPLQAMPKSGGPLACWS